MRPEENLHLSGKIEPFYEARDTFFPYGAHSEHKNRSRAGLLTTFRAIRVHRGSKCERSRQSLDRARAYLKQVEVQQPVPVLVLGDFEYAVDVVVGVLAYVVRPERAAEIVAVELGHLPLRALGPVPQHDPLGRRLVQVGRRPRARVRLDGRIVGRGRRQQPDAGVERPELRPAHGDHHAVVRVLQLRYGRRQRRFGQVGPVDGQQPVAYVYGACPVGQSACDRHRRMLIVVRVTTARIIYCARPKASSNRTRYSRVQMRGIDVAFYRSTHNIDHRVLQIVS